MTGKSVGMRRQARLRRPKAAKNHPRPACGLPIQPETGTTCAGAAFIWRISVQTYQTHPPLAAAHLPEYLDAESLNIAAATNQSYFVKTHDPPPDRDESRLHRPGWTLSRNFLFSFFAVLRVRA
jgi:hypothetical protein